jgi:hypothetical protein
MRAISRSPDLVPVTVEGQRTDGLYLVRRDHWPTTIAVPVVPNYAEVPYPVRANLICEDGNIQRGELYWPWPKRFRKHGLLAGGSAVLEWATSLGRLGGQRSVPIPDGATVTALEGAAEELAAQTPSHLRTTPDHLYWFEQDGADLVLHRIDREDNAESQTWEGLEFDGVVCTLLGDGLFLISTDDLAAALIRWGTTDPLWSVDYSEDEGTTHPFNGRLWSDAIAYGSQLLLPYRVSPSLAAGYLRVDRATGALVADEPIELGDRPLEEPELHLDSPTFGRQDAKAACVGASWTTSPLPNEVSVRGLLAAGGALVPALIFSDTVFALSPQDNSRLWTVNGGDDFEAEGTHGETTPFERYTVVCCDDTRVLLWVCEFTYTYHDAPTNYDSPTPPSRKYHMADSDIEHVDANSTEYEGDGSRGTRVVYESFDSDPEWTFVPSDGPIAETRFAANNATGAYDYATMESNPIEPDPVQQLVLSGIRYGYRVLDLSDGSTLQECWLRDLDGPSLDGTREGATEHEYLELATGDGEHATRTQSFSWDAWSGLPEEANYPFVPDAVDKNWSDLIPFAEGKRALFLRLDILQEGTIYVPANLYPGEKAFFGPFGANSWTHIDGLALYSYPFATTWTRERVTLAGDSPVIGDSSSIQPIFTFPFLDPDAIEYPTDLDDIHWAFNTTDVEIHAHAMMFDVARIDLEYDGLPRWDAVEAVLCGDKVLFGPGFRNLGRVEDLGGGAS